MIYSKEIFSIGFFLFLLFTTRILFLIADTAAPVVTETSNKIITLIIPTDIPELLAWSSPKSITFKCLPKIQSSKLPTTIGPTIIRACSHVRASKPSCNQYTALRNSYSFTSEAINIFINEEKNAWLQQDSIANIDSLCATRKSIIHHALS